MTATKNPSVKINPEDRYVVIVGSSVVYASRYKAGCKGFCDAYSDDQTQGRIAKLLRPC